MERNNILSREQRILIAATKIFARKDYHLVTMEEIAEELRVGKGTVYRYYKSKEDLYFSIINQGLEALYNYVKRETDKETDLLLKIKKAIYCAMRFFEKNKPFVKLFLQEEIKFQSKGMMQCQKTLDKTIKLIEKLIWDAQLEKLLKLVNISDAANLLVGMAKQIFISSATSNEEQNLSIEKSTDFIYDVFLYGLAINKKEE